MEGSEAIKDLDFEDEETLQTTNRAVALGLVIFSIYSLAGGSLALEQRQAGALPLVNDELISLLIAISAISMILSLVKFGLTFETFFSHDMCSFATGENFNLVYTFLFFLAWGITTAVLTFRADSPFVNLGSGYFSVWTCALLATFIFAVNVINKLDTSPEVVFSSSVVTLVAALSVIVLLTGGINCGVVGSFYCNDGKTIFGFVAAALSVVMLGMMYLVVKGKLNFGSLGEEKSFALLALLLVVVWALAVGVTTVFGIPFGLAPNGFFSVWGAYIGSCVLLMNAHERFTEGDTRSNMERRSLLFILVTSSALIATCGSIECSVVPQCSPFTIYGIAIGIAQALGCIAALKFFWLEGVAYEKYFAIALVLLAVINVFVLTFAFDSLFSTSSSSYFSVFATLFFAFGYLNQVTPTADGDHLLAKCLGSAYVEEKHALLRRKVFVTSLAVLVNIVAAVAVCVNDECVNDELFVFIVGGISLLILVLIFFLSERPQLLTGLRILFLGLWVVALPYETFSGPFDQVSLTGNGFYSAWAILAAAVWMLF